MTEYLCECRIIAPDAAAGRSDLEAALVEQFKGFTRTTGLGAWKSQRGETFIENVYIYDVAVPMGDEGNGAYALKPLAKILLDGGEEAVYTRDDLCFVTIYTKADFA
jgi:hypothetical protein